MGGVEDMSMLDQNGNMMHALDMDMSLPMDMDLGLSPGANEPQNAYGQMSAQMNGMNGMNGQGQGQQYMDNGAGSTQADTPALVRKDSSGDSVLGTPGAGPLPTGFGMAPPGGSSTLTEFTKRRNWSQRIIEEVKDFLHILTPDGRILYVSPSCKHITGYEPQTLIGKFIGEYVHPDDSGIFMREFNESIASGNSLRFFYRFKKEDGTYMIFECDGHPHISPDSQGAPAGYNSSPNPSGPVAGLCRGFFMMARPYPTKNAALLDSFLEHKIENERLMKRIEELKREEHEENAEQDRLYRDQIASVSQGAATPSEPQVNRTSADLNTADTPGGISTPNYQGMPPPAKPTMSNTALTRQNLDSALSAQKPDSIADKMSRYEASSTHLESIELLTGLRYRDGERSHGISTGDTSPALIRGDAGIAILLDRDREGGKKERKKLKVADEYVCADCGTLDSPEWRKGPKGPKTLCNACGLRWAKKEKKRSGDDGKSTSPVQTAGLTASGERPSLNHMGSSMSSSGRTGQTPGSAGASTVQQPPSLQAQASTGSG